MRFLRYLGKSIWADRQYAALLIGMPIILAVLSAMDNEWYNTLAFGVALCGGLLHAIDQPLVQFATTVAEKADENNLVLVFKDSDGNVVTRWVSREVKTDV